MINLNNHSETDVMLNLFQHLTKTRMKTLIQLQGQALPDKARAFRSHSEQSEESILNCHAEFISASCQNPHEDVNSEDSETSSE